MILFTTTPDALKIGRVFTNGWLSGFWLARQQARKLFCTADVVLLITSDFTWTSVHMSSSSQRQTSNNYYNFSFLFFNHH